MERSSVKTGNLTLDTKLVDTSLSRIAVHSMLLHQSFLCTLSPETRELTVVARFPLFPRYAD